MDDNFIISRFDLAYDSLIREVEGEEFSRYASSGYLRHRRLGYLYVCQALNRKRGTARVLDIGASFLTVLASRIFDCSMFAIDKTNYLSEKKPSEQITLKICDLTRDPIPFPSGYFDAVIFSEVIEHLPIR